jgi:hypothetical protein
MEKWIAASTGETQLDRFIKEKLCLKDRLDVERVPMTKADVLRHGRKVGRMYCVEGPRRLRTTAIWIEPEHRVLFYDSTGKRFGEARLSEAPVLEAA